MSSKVFGRGFHSVYQEHHLTLGIGFPLEAYSGSVPTMLNQVALAQQVEQGGFAALWSRDVPLLDPSFGDTGQIYDPWVWLGFIVAHTSHIALGTGSIILPLRQPVDLAKAAASVDRLSAGRLVLGVASGDRPIEYSVYDVPFDAREQLFRDTFQFIQTTTHRPIDWDDQIAGLRPHVDVLPKCHAGHLPLLVTGNSRQSVEWIAEHADGWLMYPRPVEHQRQVLTQWKSALEKAALKKTTLDNAVAAEADSSWKPFSQSLYIDLAENPDAAATPIHLGYRVGRKGLVSHLEALRDIGVNHVCFNIKFSTRPVDEVLQELIEYVVPQFPAQGL